MMLIGIIALIAVGLILFWHFKDISSHNVYFSPNARNYIGKSYTLEFPVIHGVGILQIDKTTWRIRCSDLPAGARIKIVGVEGLVLIAEPGVW